MISDVIIKRLNKYQDERGWLAEIYRSDEFNYQPVMSYISVTKPNVIRGPHEHKFQSDCFIFIGPGSFKLYLWDGRIENRENFDKENEYMEIEVGENNPMLIIVPPGVVHAYKCVSDCDGWCINFPDKLYKGKEKKEEVDEIRWENNLESPYKIQ